MDEYEREVDEYVGRDEDLPSYVERLERLVDEGIDDEDDEPVRPPSIRPRTPARSSAWSPRSSSFLRDQGPEG